MAEMNEEMIKLADELIAASEAYFKEYEKNNKSTDPVIWVENNTTKAMVIMTRGQYAGQLKSFIDSGMNYVI